MSHGGLDGGERSGRGRSARESPGPAPAGVTRRAVTGALAATGLTAAGLTAAGLAAAGGGVARARAAERGAPSGGLRLRLPAPTGPHRIGVTTLHLADRSRRDPWQAGIPVREVMVTVFHPARTVRGRSVAPQMAREAAEVFGEFDTAVLHPELPTSGVDWSATRTHAYSGAPAQAVRRPVLLYSPGGGDPRTMGTSLAEELAGHGWVVVTVDHPGDAGEVAFPAATPHRGRVRRTDLRGNPRSDPGVFRTAIGTRVADLRFVLDRLEDLAAGRNPDVPGRALPEGLGGALDLGRVGVYGHSAGGTCAAQALYEDRRIGAAVNLEGFLDHPPERPGEEGALFPVARYGVDRPLLLVGTDGFPHRGELERSWSAMLAHGGPGTGRRQLAGATHGVFTDYAALAPQLEAAGLMSAGDRRKLVGAVGPRQSVPWVRHQVLSFFARHLPAP
ncbi:alpha/beta hydrolase [Streptomyces sp. NPDC002055]|uniref:alpha/beta hydrolase family protein n=1 Tax=Streptomyces sp. NPDC002055 TaxID=3154534 RepID=UPI00333490C5